MLFFISGQVYQGHRTPQNLTPKIRKIKLCYQAYLKPFSNKPGVWLRKPPEELL